MNYDWNNPRQQKAERKALRRAKWRAFWRGFTIVIFGSRRPMVDTARFWRDVQRFGGREPAPRPSQEKQYRAYREARGYVDEPLDTAESVNADREKT